MVGLLALLLLAAGCGAHDSPVQPAEPSVPQPPFLPVEGELPEARTTWPTYIFFILIDTLRADHVGAYGDDRGLTPFLDQLAAEGDVFENAAATSSWTSPSVASMFTSRYPTSVGMVDRMDILAPRYVTLAELLARRGGYVTYAVSTNWYASEKVGLDQGFGTFERPVETVSYPDDFPMWPAEAVSRQAFTWLKKWLDTREKPAPLFMFLHYTDPHDPYFAHPDLISAPEPPGRFDGSRRGLDEMGRTPPEELTAADIGRIKSLYEGEVRYCDQWIGNFLVSVGKLGIRLDETLLVITSDHGEGLWNHGVRNHGTDLYEELLHVPLIVKLPGPRSDVGHRITQHVSLLDIAPTILSFCGIDPPRAFQGRDMSPLFRDEERDSAIDYIYSEMKYAGRNLESIRKDSFKLIRDRDEDPADARSFELYDLSRDPSETRNLIGTGQQMERHLLTALGKWSVAILADAPIPIGQKLEDLDAEVLEGLRALGYVGEDALDRQH